MYKYCKQTGAEFPTIYTYSRLNGRAATINIIIHATCIPHIIIRLQLCTPRSCVTSLTRSRRSQGRHEQSTYIRTAYYNVHVYAQRDSRGLRRPTAAATATATAMTTTATDGPRARDTIYAYELKVVVMPVIYVAFRLCDYNLYVCPALRNETCF